MVPFPFKVLDMESERELSLCCEQAQLQEVSRLRARRRSLVLATALIDEQGELNQELLSAMVTALERHGSLYKDELLAAHHLFILRKLKEERDFARSLKKFSRPLCHKGAERLVKEAAGLPAERVIADCHVRRAVLSALLTLLRQNVGSCFATAPAILIHEEQPEKFLADLYELLMTGVLKRTFGGVEYSVPLSPSSGVGDLRKKITPRAWLSPGIIAALEATGLIEMEDSLEKRCEAARHLIARFGESVTVEELFRLLLLKELGLKASDLEESEKIDQVALMRGIAFGHGSKKQVLAEQLLAREREAKAAFKGVVDNALLKAWEFTVASFSEVKMDFSRWNLYASLGFDSAEKGGIGELIFEFIDEKVRSANEKIQESHAHYEIAFDQVRASEVLLRNASSESEMRRLRAEYQGRYHHMYACLDQRNQIHSDAAHYAQFFSFLIKRYSEKFPEFFQEIYDAEMQELAPVEYDDSPAGFRLVYKHGRSDAYAWSLLYSQEQWVNALVDFFNTVEPAVAEACESDKAKEDVRELTTAINFRVRRADFLEGALRRMARAHHSVPAEKKPWAYTSGGTMLSLLKTYFRLPGEVMVESRCVESEMDLLIFLLDTLKGLPPKFTDRFLTSPEKGMLINSPTHAFILHPGWPHFKEGWQDNGFTYTWVRDTFLLPRESFIAELTFSSEEQLALVERFSERLTSMARHRCQKEFSYAVPTRSVPEFREALASAILPSPQLLEILDGFIYENIKDPPSPLLFADTNWTDAYFAFLVSPSTGRLELWRMDRSGRRGVPMSSWKLWLDGSQKIPWTLCINPDQYS